MWLPANSVMMQQTGYPLAMGRFEEVETPMNDQTNQPPQGHHHHQNAQQGTDQGGQPGYTPTDAAAGSGPSGEQPSYNWQDPQTGMIATAGSATGAVAPQGDLGHVSFNINDPQERQRIMQQLQDYQNGNTQRLQHTDLGNMAHSWVDQATPQHVADATTHAAQQLPPQQQTDFIHGVTGWLQQHGISPQQAGVQTPAGQPLTPHDVGKVVGHAQEQNPDIIKQMFSPGGALQNPAVQVGLAGALAFAASKLLK